MLFPKYIETLDGRVIIFAPEQDHSAIAQRLDEFPASAGLVSAARHPRGKFFGESTGLSMRANPKLDWSAHIWFMGVLDGRPAFGTKANVLDQAGATDIHRTELVEYEGVIFLGGEIGSAAALYEFFLP